MSLELATSIINAAHSDMVFETYPSKCWVWLSDLPRGYCGGAYPKDHPQLPQVIADLLVDGWKLETPEEVSAMASERR